MSLLRNPLQLYQKKKKKKKSSVSAYGTGKYEIMMDKRRSHKSSPSLIACRLATETWRADSRCVRQSVWEGRFG